MTTLTETSHPGEFIVSEANGHRSRETVTIATGADLKPCTVLGKVTASGKYVQFNQDGADGSENAAGILYGDALAASADAEAVAVVRDAEVRGSDLIWPDDIDPAEQTAAEGELAALGIIIR